MPAATNRNRFQARMATLTAEWPVSHLVDTWNRFAGVAPFDGLKPIKKFTSRKTRRGADLGRGSATIPGRSATGGRRQARKGQPEEVPGQERPARPGAEGRN
jgi:hypothetical protein